jgi:crossover junction endodeoxyribonuclease RuvC
LKVIGIDPGITKVGYGIIEEDLKVIETGIFIPSKKLNFEGKIGFLLKNIEILIEKFNPEIISIEEIYVAKNTQIALKIGIFTGGIIGLSVLKNIKFILIPPREIKQLITGNGGATKEQIKFMVENLTSYLNFKNFEETDAVAVAISTIFKLKENVILYKR